MHDMRSIKGHVVSRHLPIEDAPFACLVCQVKYADSPSLDKHVLTDVHRARMAFRPDFAGISIRRQPRTLSTDGMNPDAIPIPMADNNHQQHPLPFSHKKPTRSLLVSCRKPLPTIQLQEADWLPIIQLQEADPLSTGQLQEADLLPTGQPQEVDSLPTGQPQEANPLPTVQPIRSLLFSRGKLRRSPLSSHRWSHSHLSSCRQVLSMQFVLSRLLTLQAATVPVEVATEEMGEVVVTQIEAMSVIP